MFGKGNRRLLKVVSSILVFIMSFVLFSDLALAVQGATIEELEIEFVNSNYLYKDRLCQS